MLVVSLTTYSCSTKTQTSLKKKGKLQKDEQKKQLEKSVARKRDPIPKVLSPGKIRSRVLQREKEQKKRLHT